MIGLLVMTENETELSLFNRESYEEFKLDPTVSLPSLALVPLGSYTCVGRAVEVGKLTLRLFLSSRDSYL